LKYLHTIFGTDKVSDILKIGKIKIRIAVVGLSIGGFIAAGI
jgi:hypothetical protein